jgi:acetoin utilization protein AcuB
MMNSNMTVSEIMTRHPIVVKPGTPIDEVHVLFEQHKFHHLPVVHQGALIGIISRSDYLKIRHMLAYTWSGEIRTRQLYEKMCASDIMTAGPLTIEPSDTIGLAADIFLANALHALPVVEQGELVGIVTSHDVLSYAFKQLV